jgi:molybdate transport system substrate-binding protein
LKGDIVKKITSLWMTVLLITIATTALGIFTGCAPATPVTLNVSAAASLTDALKELNTLYVQINQNVTVTPNFASSGTLQTQIQNGAPCDVFISAAPAQMDNLQKGQLIVGNNRKNLLLNKVVLVAPGANPLGLKSFSDLAGDSVKKIAIGDPKSVPAGTYAQQIFDELGITAKIQSKLILGSDVRQVLTYVESGNVDAGVVYSTDAKTSTKITVVANGPDDVNAKIVYPVAVIKASKVAEAARKYEDFLFSTDAKAVFEKYGFSMAGK